MKKTNSLFVVVVCILAGCNSLAPKSSLDELAWLEGEWISEGKHGGSQTHELWLRRGEEMKGFGLVIKKGDTTFVEDLVLRETDGVLNYVAKTPQNQSEVAFKLVNSSDTNWVFENPNHDFPKRIEYMKIGEGFTAIVSGGSRRFELNFDKQ